MFKLMNLYTNSGLAIRIEYGGQYVEFEISTLITKRNKEDLNEKEQFLLLNAYLDYRGEEFKKRLMDLYLEIDDTLIALINRKDISPLPYSIVHPILDMLDYAEVLNFVKDVYKITPPKDLMDVFDPKIELDGDGTRAQTYTKQDYLELAALVVTLKTILGPVGHFAYIKNAQFANMNKEYMLFTFLLTHPIYETPAMQKLYDFIVKKLEKKNSKEGPTSSNIQIIEKRIPESEMPAYVLATALYNRLIVGSIVNDVPHNNIITKLNTYVSNKISSRRDLSSAVRNKQPMTDDSGGDNKESIIEAFRVISKLPAGWIVEINYAVSDILAMARQLPVEIDMSIVQDMYITNKIFLERDISNEQRILLGYIFKSIIDPRSIEHINRENIVKMLSVGFAYLWALDLKYIAILLCSIAEEEKDDVISINSSVNRSRLTAELKEELAYLYPYTRVINATTSANVAEEAINTIANEIYDTKWLTIVDDKYTSEIVDNRSQLKMVPSDLKIKLAEMIIKLEKILD